MGSSRWILVAASLAVAQLAGAQADGPAAVESALPPVKAPPLQLVTPKPLAPAGPSASAAATAVPRPAMFAPASAATVKRLTVEERDEWRFLKDAAASTRFETDASRIALAKSSHAGVRSIATGLLEHHRTADITLQQMLRMRNMAPPMLTNEQRKALNRLGKINGNKFDREYLDQVARRSAQENIAAFERASTVVRDPMLKAWIDRSLPTLRDQLSTADRVSSGGTRVARAGVAAAKPSAASLATRAMGSSAQR